MIQRCPTCGHWWLRQPRWYQLWLWPLYWLRCPFLDLYERPVLLDEDDFIAELLRR